MSKTDIKSMLPQELKDYFEAAGERQFRADQAFSWLHSGAASFQDMTNLPEALREKLDEEFYIAVPVLLKKQESKEDGSIKYLWEMPGGAAIESVVMEYAHGYTACISTQAGCKMGCRFCASAIGGFQRNLSSSEMEDQVLFSGRDCGKKISNIVLMGVGEPLDNFDNVIRFLEIIRHPSGMNIGARHISLSTCGIAENIDKMADHNIQLTLSVSLHAPDDETRSLLMPVNRPGGVDELLKACERYFRKTHRRVSYEYAMISGINDTGRHAVLLKKKLKNSGCHVNIIVLNEIPGSPYKASSPESVKAFAETLRRGGVNCTVRRRLGGDIEASCGQLRSRALQ